MTRSKRLQPIQQLAGDREREAATQVDLARRALDDHERQLVQLRQYRAEYADRVSTAAAPDVARLQNFHAFLGRQRTVRADAMPRISLHADKIIAAHRFQK